MKEREMSGNSEDADREDQFRDFVRKILLGEHGKAVLEGVLRYECNRGLTPRGWLEQGNYFSQEELLSFLKKHGFE